MSIEGIDRHPIADVLSTHDPKILEVVVGLHDFRCYLNVAGFVEFDTSVIFHV